MNHLGLELLASLEQNFAESKILNLTGTARVRLSQLLFLNPIRPIDRKIIDALKRDFKAEGCLQHEIDCSVPAIISDASRTLALEALNVSAERFKATSRNRPAEFELPSNVQLQCLHGQHRIVAATEYLPSGDRWWLVDIYGEGEEINSSMRLITKDCTQDLTTKRDRSLEKGTLIQRISRTERSSARSDSASLMAIEWKNTVGERGLPPTKNGILTN